MRPSRLDDRGKKTVKSDQKCNYVLYCWATGHTRFLSRVGVAPTDHELNRLSNSWPTTCLSLYSHTRIRTLRYLFGGLHLLFMRTCAPPYASKVFPLKKIKKTNNGEVTPVCVIRNLSPPLAFDFCFGWGSWKKARNKIPLGAYRSWTDVRTRFSQTNFYTSLSQFSIRDGYRILPKFLFRKSDTCSRSASTDFPSRWSYSSVYLTTNTCDNWRLESFAPTTFTNLPKQPCERLRNG